MASKAWLLRFPDGSSKRVDEASPVLVGRGSLEHAEDARLSRKQLHFFVRGASLVARCGGVNPSFVHRPGEAAQPMSKGEEVEARAGFRFKVLSIGPELAVEGAGQVAGEDTVSMEEEEGVAQGEAEPVTPGSGACMYGAACWNTHARHRRSLFHKSAPRASPTLEMTPEVARGTRVLAFPSISTGTFMFDAERAVPVLVEEARAFLARHPALHLMLVDLKLSEVLSMVTGMLGSHPRFHCVTGDLTTINSHAAAGRIRVDALANTTNVHLSQKGSGMNRAIHTACKELGECTQRLYEGKAKVGVPMPVELPESSEWVQREGIRTIIHVYGPNMNRSRPDFLGDDYERGCELLRATYRNLFECFARVGGEPETPLTGEPERKRARVSDRVEPETKGRWDSVLFPYSFHPEAHPDVVVDYDEHTVVIRDKFPKSRHHFLVLPRNRSVPFFSYLTRDHLPLLQHMRERARLIQAQYAPLKMLVGFHAIPSLRQLHLHVLTDDFESPSLKHKKHWNSFNTNFFITPDKFETRLREDGKIGIREHEEKFKAMLKKPLQCHRCGGNMRHMPQLKQHIAICNLTSE